MTGIDQNDAVLCFIMFHVSGEITLQARAGKIIFQVRGSQTRTPAASPFYGAGAKNATAFYMQQKFTNEPS